MAVEQDAVAKMPEGYDFNTAAAIPLTGLTAYQAIVEELEAKPGQTILIPGGSGSFGQMAVPIAKALGLRVIVTGNARAKEQFLAMMEREPRRFIAQEVIDFEDLDILEDGEAVPRKADLRAFVLSGNETRVWKSGLTRFSRNPDSFIVNSSQGGGFKDTWVLSQ